MSPEHGPKDDGGKYSAKNMVRRAAAHVMPSGRSSGEKEQHSSTPPAPPNGSPQDSRNAPRAPKRTQTIDNSAPTKPATQGPPSQGATERPPAARSMTPSPNPAQAQTPAFYPPALVPAPTPLPPAGTPAKRPERPEYRDPPQRTERPRSAEPPTRRTPAPEPSAQGNEEPVRLRENKYQDEIEQLSERNRILEERCRFYESEPYRQELVSIRTHLQVNELLEPWQISQKFQAIGKDIENVSRNVSEFLADSCPPLGLCNTSLFFSLSQSSFPKTDPSITGPPVPAEDLVDFSCRSLINEQLMEHIFHQRLFHPGLSQEYNKMLSETYEKVRAQESQTIAGRWRISSFNAYNTTEFSTHNIALHFCEHTLRQLFRGFYGEKPAEEVLNKFFPQIAAVFQHAWDWYSLAKSSVVLLDFEPFYVSPGSQFLPDYHNLEGRKPKSPSSGTILLTSRLGLISSEAKGKGETPTRIVQLKATTLAAEYFSG